MAKYTADPDAFWWKASRKRVFSVIFDTVNFITEAQSYRTQGNHTTETFLNQVLTRRFGSFPWLPGREPAWTGQLFLKAFYQ